MNQIRADLVTKIRLRKLINDKVDKAVKVGRDNNQPEFVIELIDRVFRSFCVALHMEKMRAGEGADADEAQDIVCSLLSNMTIELMLNLVPRGADPDLITGCANNIIERLVNHINVALDVNYSLTTSVESATMGDKPETEH